MAARSRSAAGPARKQPGRNAPAGGGRRSLRTAEHSKTASSRFRSGLTVRAALIAATLIAGGALAYMPVMDYFELRSELHQLEHEGDQLHEDLDSAYRNVQVAESRNAERARCYANYVPPGAESYSIPGSSGCVQ